LGGGKLLLDGGEEIGEEVGHKEIRPFLPHFSAFGKWKARQ
jgi:hypothetical protein